MLDDRLLQLWREQGFVRCKKVIEPKRIAALRDWVDFVATWRPTDAHPNPVLLHHELTTEGVVIARVENLVPNHDGFRRLVTAGSLPELGSQLAGDDVVLYKEKVNYKHPGGAGFAPHQDATAYKFVDEHLTCMVAIDDATLDNGCLEMVPGCHDALLQTDGDGCIDRDVAATLDWQPVPIRAGDVLWFHSRTPHRSAANGTDSPRRALFLTYNAASAGDLRTEYYADKIRQLRERPRTGDRARISTIGHFQGRDPDEQPIEEMA